MEKKFNKVIAKCVKFYKAHKLVTWGKDHFNEKGKGVSSDTLTHKVRISGHSEGLGTRPGLSVLRTVTEEPLIGVQYTKGRDLCLCKSRKTGETHRGKYR